MRCGETTNALPALFMIHPFPSLSRLLILLHLTPSLLEATPRPPTTCVLTAWPTKIKAAAPNRPWRILHSSFGAAINLEKLRTTE